MGQHRRLVLLGWLVFVLAAAGLAPQAAHKLQGAGFDVPGSASAKATRVLESDFHAASTTSAVVVYHSNTMRVGDTAFAAAVAGADRRLKALPGVAAVTSAATGDPRLISKDRHTAMSVVALSGGENAAQNAIPSVRSQLSGLPVKASVTGFPAVQYDTFKLSERDLKTTELVTFPVVTILLLVFFGTLVAASVPLILGLSAVVIATGMLSLLASQFTISIFALNIGSLIGLGLSIDFSLIMVRRFRDELQQGRSVADAVAVTMATSGRSIIFSGLMLVTSMVAVTAVFHDLMIVRSISLGVALVSVIGLLAGATLLPALLATLGHRINRLRVIPTRRRSAESGPGTWYRLSVSVMRRPVRWLLASLLVLGLLAVPLLHIRLVGASTGSLPAASESVQGAQQAERAFGANELTPISIVVKAGRPGGVFDTRFRSGLRQLTTTLAADPRASQVLSLSTVLKGIPDTQVVRRDAFTRSLSTAQAQIADQFVNLDGAADTALVSVIPRAGEYSREHQQFVTDLRHQIVPSIVGLRGYQVLVGGDAASFVDFRTALYGRFPLVALIVTLLVLMLLLAVFRSIVLPLKAILMSVLPLFATYGALVWLFQDGHGQSLFDFQSQGRLNVVTPLIIFVILFGLSSDYEVFLLSRVRENYDRTHDTQSSVAAGMQQTAGLITAAGLILIATFGSLAVSSVETLKEIGVGLAIGVLLDATIVRLIMVPAAMRLMKEANWWMPTWMHRWLPRIEAETISVPEPGAVPDTATVPILTRSAS